ncbi:MAG: GntR family transcriptional regulator [Thermaerobacter sp.]|nr:GntR family transcriptional regulator [Thermaerobacter sp.]
MPRETGARPFQTKKDWILEGLRQDILEGRYPPGTRLVTRQIAEDYGTSEIPVREALNQLHQEGLIRTEPHVGAVTTPLSGADLRELFEVRMTLEGLAVRLAAPRLTDADIAAAAVLNDTLRAAVERSDAVTELNRLNRAFHERLYASCDNRRLLDLLKSLWDHSGRYPPPLTGNDPPTRSSVAEHAAILDALRARDGARAEQLTLAHKQRSMDRIVKRVEQHEAATHRD